jgi:hypothetical protein
VFERRVAHGYFVVSAAAGLFVEPSLGPVLANYGLENLRFTKPVYPGDTITVRLTVKQKTAKDTREGEVPQGVVEWDVEVRNQEAEVVAVYSILTLVKFRAGDGTECGAASTREHGRDHTSHAVGLRVTGCFAGACRRRGEYAAPSC